MIKTKKNENNKNGAILSVFGRPINLHTAGYLSQDEGSDSIFDDLAAHQFGEKDINGTYYKLPLEFIDKSNIKKEHHVGESTKKTQNTTSNLFFNEDPSLVTYLDASTGSDFYSYGSNLEINGKIDTEFLTFSAEIKSDFQLDESGWSSNFYAIQNVMMSRYRASLNVIDYLKDKHDVHSIWETSLFKTIMAHKHNPKEYFESQGTHLIYGFEIGAGKREVATDSKGEGKSASKLSVELAAEKKGILGIGKASFSASTFIQKLNDHKYSKTKTHSIERGKLVGTSVDADGLQIKEPALISYNGKFLPIHELIKPFDTDENISGMYQKAYEEYKKSFKSITPTPRVIINNTIELTAGEHDFSGNSETQLRGIKFCDFKQRAFRITITDTNGITIKLSGNNVNSENKDSLNKINIDKDIIHFLYAGNSDKRPDKFAAIKTVKIEPISSDNGLDLVTIFKNPDYQYDQPWYSATVGDNISNFKKIAFDNNMHSIIVPKDCEVRLYNDPLLESEGGSMSGNIKGPRFIQKLWNGSLLSALKSRKYTNPLVVLFIAYDQDFNHPYISVPIHNYKHLDPDYMKKKLATFFTPAELSNINNLKHSISSIFVPKGITAIGRSDKHGVPDQTIKGEGKGVDRLDNNDSWSALVLEKNS